MRLHIGPLDRKALDPFLPNGDSTLALARMLKHFAVSHLEFEVRLILKPECVTTVVLSARAQAPHRLGWDSFLTAGHFKRGEIRYMLKLRTPRPPFGTALRAVA